MKTYIAPSIISHDVVTVTLLKRPEFLEENPTLKAFHANLGFGL